jgi:hypothetical protein
MGALCGLCGRHADEGVIRFCGVRPHREIGAVRAWLELALCEACGKNLEKHLKRAIPKRLFSFRAVLPLTATP